VNSTLILDDILDIVMTKSVNLFNAERGFLMLLDENNRLQFKTAHNIKKEQFNSEDMRISTTIADTVVKTGKSVYTSDALNDQRFAQKASIIDLHIRSAMVVPLKIKTEIIGVLYLDNSSQTNIFIKQDLVLFEMFAAQAALAIHNARLYSEVLELQKYQQNIIANIPIGLLVVDTGANITAVNGSIQKIFDKIGWHQFSNNLIGKKIIDCVPDKYRRTFIESLAADKNQPVIIPRFNIDCQDKEIVLKLHFCPFDNYHGDKSGHIILFEDITEQVILEQYLILPRN
jgi:PAS domain S-box-containing protein